LTNANASPWMESPIAGRMSPLQTLNRRDLVRLRRFAPPTTPLLAASAVPVRADPAPASRSRRLLSMFHFSRLAVPGVMLGCSGFFISCSQSLESNPTYQEHVARVEKIEESMNDTKNRISLLNNEFQTVTKDVNTLVAAGTAGSGEDVKTLGARVTTLENSIK